MNNFLVENGRIFIGGKETEDPLLIGYTILDLIEEGTKIKIDNSIEEVFYEKDEVYLKHDPDQLKRIITGVYIGNGTVLYYVSSGIEVSKHYSYELSKSKSYENI